MWAKPKFRRVKNAHYRTIYSFSSADVLLVDARTNNNLVNELIFLLLFYDNDFQTRCPFQEILKDMNILLEI